MESTIQNLRLEAAASDLVRALGGDWKPGGAMCRCPAHEDSIPSLSVRVGRQSLLFKCFAGCPANEVIREIRRMRLLIPTDHSAHPTAADGVADVAMADRAAAIWNLANAITDTPGERYLIGRGIRTPTPALRFHPNTPLGRGRDVRFRPAIIAPICERRKLVAIQRLFLEGDPPILAPDLAKAKLTLGRPLSGAVMLAPSGSTLGLAEGVETALSAAILLGLPVWATLGNERLARITLPQVVQRLILLPDADAGGRRANLLAQSAYARDGLVIETLWPWHGMNDWNDVLRAEGERGEARMRLVA